MNSADRPDHSTSTSVESALLLPRAQAAKYMVRADVPLSVIGRVLDKAGRRRVTDSLHSMDAGRQLPP